MNKKDILVALGGIVVGVAATKIADSISARTSEATPDETEVIETAGETTYNYKVTFTNGATMHFNTSCRLEREVLDSIEKTVVDARVFQRVIDKLSSHHIFPVSLRCYAA